MSETDNVENVDGLLESLMEPLEDSVEEFDLSTLFTKTENTSAQEECDRFFGELAINVVNLWGENDKIIHIVCKPGSSYHVKKAFNEADLSRLTPDFQGYYKELIKEIEWSEQPGVETIQIITIKQAIRSQEVIAAHTWVSDPSMGYYDVLRQKGLLIQPSMAELRMLVLLDALLDARERKPKILAGTAMPGMRTGK